MPAKGSAEWKGDIPTGTGTFTAGDTISGGYTFKSRFEDGPGSNPEQLIAAAHAACFSMALSSLLAQAGNPPESVHTDATVTPQTSRRPADDHEDRLGHRRASAGLDEAAFVEHAKAAKAGCPVSRALAGVPEITLEALPRNSDVRFATARTVDGAPRATPACTGPAGRAVAAVPREIA
jgi:osmotically inducible protein OsmC